MSVASGGGRPPPARTGMTPLTLADRLKKDPGEERLNFRRCMVRLSMWEKFRRGPSQIREDKTMSPSYFVAGLPLLVIAIVLVRATFPLGPTPQRSHDTAETERNWLATPAIGRRARWIMR